MITDHAYDAGWPRNDSRGCIVQVEIGGRGTSGEYQPCCEPEEEHARTEYFRARPPGDMHEPKPYTDELDWPDNGQFID